MENCPICKKELKHGALRQHLLKEHQTNDIDLIVYLSKENKSMKWARELPENVLRAFLIKSKEYNGLSKIYASQFCASYRHIAYVRNFDIEKDIALFFEKILPWKLVHRFACNNKELCKLECPDSEEQEQKVYQHFMLEKNPYYKHDSRLSPWSKDFNGYKGMTEEEKKAAVRKANKADTKEYKLRLEYWEKRYPDKEEAYRKWKEECNRHVFNLKRCIERHGIEEGTRIFNERNRKWLNTLNSKPIEEIQRINKSKITKLGSKSTIESKLMLNLISEEFRNIYIKPAKVIVDCLYEGKIIEFYGDYWHCNPKIWKEDTYNKTLHKTAKEKWEYDKQRIKKIEDLGYTVKIVWESDFIDNEEKVIQECKEFLGVK